MTRSTKTATTQTAQRVVAGLLLTLAVAGALAYQSQSASAQQARLACQTRDALLAQLDRQYGEAPVAVGVSGGALVELLSAEDGGTWTLVVTSPKGISCMVAAGEGWRPVTPKETGPTA